MSALAGMNLAAAFIVELLALAAVGYWGFNASDNVVARVMLGVGAPLAVAIFWGISLAPKSSRRLQEPALSTAKLAVFAAAALALAAAGQPTWAVVYFAAAAVNLALLALLKQ